MVHKAFFRIPIYVILVNIIFACAAQKNAAKAENIPAENKSNATEIMAEDTSGLYESYLEKAEAYKIKGDTAAALNNYDLAIKLRPQSARAYELKGYLLSDSRSFAEAAKNLQKAVDLKAESATLFSRLGFVYTRINEPAEAVNYLGKAIALEPSNLENYAHRAFAYIELQKYDRAEQDYRLFLMKNHNDAIAWYNLSRAQYSQQKYDDCIFSLNKVNSLQPGYLDTYFWLGLCYAANEEFANALSWFDKAIEQKPNTGYLYFNRGIAKGRLNRNDFCPDFKKAVELGYTDAVKMVSNYCK